MQFSLKSINYVYFYSVYIFFIITLTIFVHIIDKTVSNIVLIFCQKNKIVLIFKNNK